MIIQKTMNDHFSHTEFIRRPDLPVPDAVLRKIYVHHIFPMNAVRAWLGMPITVSLSSGYRPVEHEIEHGRSGESEHTFIGLGAADYAAADNNLLLIALVSKSKYTRIAKYSGFIHCDYKQPERGLTLFDARSKNWKESNITELLS